MKRLLILLVACCFFLQSARAQQQLKPLPVKEALATRSFLSEASVDLSPDGQWLAYTLQDGQRLKQTNDPEFGIYTRSGSHVAVAGCDVWITNLKTGEAKNLTGGKGTSWGPVWSPDGRYLALYSDRNGKAQPWVWEKSTGALRQVSDIVVRVPHPREVMRWTPDNKQLLVKVLPEGMTVEGVAGLMQSPSGNSSEQQKEPGSTVTIYKATPIPPSKSPPGQTSQQPGHLNAFQYAFQADLALIDVAGGQVRRIAQGFRPRAYAFSPDGARVAFTDHKGLESDKVTQGLYDLLVVSLPEAQVRVVASNFRQYTGFSISWSPDGKLLAYTTGGLAGNGDCYVVSAGGGEPRNLTPGQHPDLGDPFRAPLWDAGGKFIYLPVFGLSPGADTLWKASVDDGKVTEVTKIPDHAIREVIAPSEGGRFWSPDAGQSLVVMTRNNETKQEGFYKIDLGTGKYTKLSEENKTYGGYPIFRMDVSADGQRVVYAAQSADQYEDIWMTDNGFRNSRRATLSNPQLERYVMGKSRVIEWLSTDGEKLHGALLLPAGYEEGKRYPLVVFQYPSDLLSRYANSFGLGRNGSATENLQLLATRGYAVLLPDVPRHLGSVMQSVAKAVVPGVDKVIEMGIADPDRLGVMGHSNGGYGVLCLVVQTTRFKAAVTRAGFGDLIGLYGHLRANGGSISTGQVEGLKTGGTIWEKRDKFIENSPVFYLDRVQTPVLIVHGNADTRVPSFLADETFVCLRRLNKEVEYAKYDGENHAESEWSYNNQLDYLNRMIAWFDKWLKEAPAEPAPLINGVGGMHRK